MSTDRETRPAEGRTYETVPAPGESGGPHPWKSELADLSLGMLASGRRRQVLAHLADCPSCLGEASALWQAGHGDTAGLHKALPRRPAGGDPSERLDRLVDRVFETARQQALDTARERLTLFVGQLSEQFGATSGWLFLPLGDEWQAVVTHRSGCRNVCMARDGRGIVPHVARTRRAYCAPDAAVDPHYVNYVPTTRSEMAVPVFDPSGELVAVFNLEANRKDALQPSRLEELQEAASVVVPDVLVLARGEACPWHPEVHGWDLTRLIQRLCVAVSEAISGPGRDDNTECSLWYVDEPKGELFVYATTGYDAEYCCERTLPLGDSFTGRVACEPRRVHDVPLELAEGFRRRDKAEQMGLRRILAVPVARPGRPAGEPAISTLNIYLFAERAGDAVPRPEVLLQLADRLGALIAAFQQHRPRVAAAVMRRELVRARSSAALLTILRVLLRALDADGGSVFALEGPDLIGVETTGLDASPAAPQAPRYHFDGDPGFTTFLARHPGACARKNDVVSETERGLPDGFPPRPLNKYREKFAGSETDHRRFLGVGVGLPGSPGDRDTGLGVLRLNRAANARPFTRCDEHLLQAVADLPPCKTAFLDWQAGRAAAARDRIEAVANVLRPVPELASTATLVDELIQALAEIYSTALPGGADFETPRSVEGIGLVMGDLPGRWQAYHSRYRREAPVTPAGLFRHVLPGFWDDPVFRTHIVTGNPGPVALDDWRGPAALASVPVLARAGERALRGNLILMFRDPVTDWNRRQLELLLNASRRLSAILAPCEEAIRPECFRLDPVEALERLLHFPLVAAAIGADWTGLRLDDRRQEVWRQKGGPGPRQDGCTASFPLLVGPYRIGELGCGFDRADARAEHGRGEFLRRVPALWARLAFGLQPFWKADFGRAARRGDGSTPWHGAIKLAPLTFAQDRKDVAPLTAALVRAAGPSDN